MQLPAQSWAGLTCQSQPLTLIVNSQNDRNHLQETPIWGEFDFLSLAHILLEIIEGWVVSNKYRSPPPGGDQGVLAPLFGCPHVIPLYTQSVVGVLNANWCPLRPCSTGIDRLPHHPQLSVPLGLIDDRNNLFCAARIHQMTYSSDIYQWNVVHSQSHNRLQGHSFSKGFPLWNL